MNGKQIPTKTQTLPRCIYTFEAVVQKGPRAGTVLAGTLALAQCETGELIGNLLPNNARSRKDIRYSIGRIRDNSITLYFEVAREIVKLVGTTEVAIEASNGVMEGSLSGLRTKDTGSWIAFATVNPPPLTLDDPVDPPSFDEEDPIELGDGECIL